MEYWDNGVIDESERVKDQKIIEEIVSELNDKEQEVYQDLIYNRRPKRTLVKKAVNTLSAYLRDPNPKTQDLEFHKRKLDSALLQLEDADEKVWAFWGHNGDDGALNADIRLGRQWTDLASEKLIETETKIKEILNASGPPRVLNPTVSASAPPSAPPSAPAPQVKLPKMELPHFRGESPAEYQAFISVFNSMIHNTHIDKVQKFSYLTASCQGEAKKIAEGFKCSAANYDSLYDALKSAYGKQRLIIQSQANRILELPEFKSSTMKGFLNKMESALRSMEEYAVDPEGLAPLLVPLVEQKMPREILSKWREEIKSEDSFSTRRLISFLHERVECLPSNEPEVWLTTRKKATQPARI